ncbi:hypothetical protein BV97_00490 [Novosphingobium resinovorum]|jgi:formylglycine-generating enzyme required for sulfatase activity|uniref:Sulfatase-modifying factor enzyme-like domain-containing protein n=1 Tax=Novosphingobium resinovorum TaxID=158500 RepID=A0A031K7Z1_9SPHN|nr:SUMF1/EgtB/PvdO family nonheme iron enzyme [Novosphingobium resinovorum]EZP84732.1 hypothetical protein BV97_00490 [Novosphingobium resinovorum]
MSIAYQDADDGMQVRPGMAWVAGGSFTMGSERFYPEEAPLGRVSVDGFWIDTTPVTNRQFAAFIDATGYTTVAEIAPDPKDYPGMLPGMDRAGALVFHKTSTPVDTSDPGNWWRFEFGADWRHPLGPGSDIGSLGLWEHPVVQIAYADAEAMRHGRERACRPRRNSNSPRGAVSKEPTMPGATNWRPAAR